MTDEDSKADRRWERWEWLPVDVLGQDRSENGLAWLVGSNHCVAFYRSYSRRAARVHACFNAAVSTGSLRRRLPVAAKIALVTAGTTAEVPASPIPPGDSELW